MSLKGLLCSSAFMMSFAVIISLITNFTGIFPGDVLNAPLRSNITILCLAVMLTLSFSRIPYNDLNPIEHSSSVIRAIVLGLVVASIVPLAGYFILAGTEWADYAKGLVFIAATPFAASVGPLSYILRGDFQHALRSTVIIYILALAWIPAIIWICLGESVDMMNVFITVLEIIGLPLILSRLLTGLDIPKDVMSIVLNCIITFLVWLSVSSADFQSAGWFIMTVFLIVAGLRTFFMGNVVETCERSAGIHWTQRVTDILMVTYKNKGIALALCAAVLMGPMSPKAMVAIAASIIVDVCWVAFMDGYLFSPKRMDRELGTEKV